MREFDWDRNKFECDRFDERRDDFKRDEGPHRGTRPHERHHDDFMEFDHRRDDHEMFKREERDDLEGLYMAVARKLRHSGRRHFGSTQDRIVRILDENGGTMNQKSLQMLLDVKPGSISEILTKMEEKGLVERSRNDDDRRAALITLKAENIDKEERPSFFMMLSEEEKQNLKAILQKVLDEGREKEV